MICEYEYNIENDDEREMNFISSLCRELGLNFIFVHTCKEGFKVAVKGEENKVFYFAYEYRQYCRRRDYLDTIYKRKSPSIEWKG